MSRLFLYLINDLCIHRIAHIWVLMDLCIDIYNCPPVFSVYYEPVMPFYEYQCTKCGHEEEVLQKISDKPLKKCPACGKSSMQKKVSAAAFRLKGGGWYETDFKSGNKKNVVGEDKASAGNKDNKKATAKKKPSGDSTKSKKVKN